MKENCKTSCFKRKRHICSWSPAVLVCVAIFILPCVVAGDTGTAIIKAIESSHAVQPEVIGSVRLKTIDSLELTLQNQYNKSLDLRVICPAIKGVLNKARHEKVVLPPLAKVGLTFKLDRNVFRELSGRIILLRIASKAGKTYWVPFQFDFIMIPRINKKISIDGNLAEYKQYPCIDFVGPYPPDAKAWGIWKDKDDLSAKAWVFWNQENLYIAAEVRDDIQVQHETARQMWKQDNLLVIVTPNGEKSSHMRFGIGNDGNKKTYVYDSPFFPQGELMPDAEFVCVRKNGKVRYEISLPWKDLMRTKPQAGMVFKMKLAVDDSDKVATPAQCGFSGGNKTIILEP